MPPVVSVGPEGIGSVSTIPGNKARNPKTSLPRGRRRNADDTRLEGAVIVRPIPKPRRVHHAVGVVISVFGSADNVVVVKIDVKAQELKVRVSNVLPSAVGVIAVGVVHPHGTADFDRTFFRFHGRIGSDFHFRTEVKGVRYS